MAVAGPWDNVTLPSPPNGPAWAQAAAQLMGATQNSINSGANAFQGWQNFNYQQQQRDFFQNPQNQALLQDALDPKNKNPNKYGPIFQAMIQQGGAPSFQQLLPLLQRQQLIQQDLDQNNAPQPPSSGPATSTQGASPANIHGDFSQPRIGYGTGETPNLNTLAANYNLPDPVLQRIATSVGASSPEDYLTPDQARVAQQRVADYVKRTSGGIQDGASPDRGGGNPVAQAGTGNQETPQGVGGSGAVSPRPTSGSGGFNPSSGAATPNVQSAQAPVNAANPPSGAAAMVPPQFRDNPQAFADYLRKQADDLSRRSRLGELIGVPSKTAEDRARSMNDRAKAIEEQLGKDVGQTEQQKNERSGVAGTAKRRELQQTRYDKMDQGIQEQDRAAFLMDDHTHAMFGILQNPNLFTGATQAQRQWLRQMVQNYMPGADPNTTLPNEALRKVTAQNLQNQLSILKADAQEAGESAGRVMLAQIRIMQDAAQNPDSSVPTLRYLTELGARASTIQHRIAQLSRDYKASHRDQLDSGFDQVLADFMKKPENKMLTPKEERDISYLSAARLPTNIKNAQEAHAWAREHGIRAGEHLRINSSYPAQYIDYDPNAK